MNAAWAFIGGSVEGDPWKGIRRRAARYFASLQS
ncbi:hypothetical protein USB125703_01965 [Pseudoclavibacter triregionum]|nr:hypothetical protein USB125703_01965 [Pseudoclavibacter triregionum]